MVSFNVCEGNPGAISFMIAAYETAPFTAERCFARVTRQGIRGCELYMLWNDCCGRDTHLALKVMGSWPVEELRARINRKYGRGLPISKDEADRYSSPPPKVWLCL